MNVGYPWLTTASIIERHKISFVKYGKEYLDSFKERYSCLVSHVHKDNQLLLNWLLRSGFEKSELKGEFYECVYQP